MKLYRLLPIIFLAAVIGISCGGNSDADRSDTSEHHHETMMEEEHHHHDGENELTLNKGEKWHLDSITNVNFKSLLAMTDKYPDVDASPEQIKDYGNDVKSGIGQLVKDCTMKGPDHEALHAWLSPVMRQMNTLTDSTDAAPDAKVYDSLRRQIKIFDEYFNVE